MDIKIDGLSYDILEEALAQAKDGRIHILDKMDEKINKNESPLEYSKRISFEKINSLKNSFPNDVLLTAFTLVMDF